MKSIKPILLIFLFLMLGLVIIFRKDAKYRAHQVIIRRTNRTSDLSISQIAREISQLERILAKQVDQSGNEGPKQDQSTQGVPRKGEGLRKNQVTEKKTELPKETPLIPTNPAKMCGKGRKLGKNYELNESLLVIKISNHFDWQNQNHLLNI